MEANLGGDDSAKPPPAAAVCVVVDTDTYNEIDDQLGVVYALLSSERIRTEPRSARWLSSASARPGPVRAARCRTAAGARLDVRGGLGVVCVTAAIQRCRVSCDLAGLSAGQSYRFTGARDQHGRGGSGILAERTGDYPGDGSPAERDVSKSRLWWRLVLVRTPVRPAGSTRLEHL